ncbi:hypothetical protein [Plesiocystis pacifica]|nr:hypothetical protein [Plesiocystis pacifica]
MSDGTLEPGEHTTVDELAQLEGVSRRQAVDLLRSLAGIGVGEFKVGRKGHPSRLVWARDPKTLAELLAAGPPASEPADALSVDADGTSKAAADTDRGEVEPGVATPVSASPLASSSEGARLRLDRPAGKGGSSTPPSSARSRARVRGSRPESESSQSPGIEHIHRLRRDLEIRVKLPADLSPREAEVLAAWIRDLSFER